MRMRLLPIILLLFCPAVFAIPPGLPDQYGKTVSLEQFADESLLVIVVTGRKLRQIKTWEERLRKTLPTLVSLRVADIAEEPQPAMDEVATKIRERAPEGVSVLIDLESTWARAYELDTEEPCLLLLDATHDEVARFRGRANKKNLALVLATLGETGLAGGDAL